MPQQSQIRLHRQLVVAINGGAVDPMILDLAATIGKRDRTQVAVVYVVEVEQHLPVDADLPHELERGERVLVAAERTARDRGLRATYDVLQARSVGAAIVDEAVQRSADLIILGAELREKYGEPTYGTTVPYVMMHAMCEVWVCRTPLAAPLVVR
ncbi:MAG: universal stress protein [Thermomicrobia bacterium]|nr:universal stress protein [Thermomicrobia bacterium]MCA1725499.1 universal stress protein [Thermomicrobia bacterium]